MCIRDSSSIRPGSSSHYLWPTNNNPMVFGGWLNRSPVIENIRPAATSMWHNFWLQNSWQCIRMKNFSCAILKISPGVSPKNPFARGSNSFLHRPIPPACPVTGTHTRLTPMAGSGTLWTGVAYWHFFFQRRNTGMLTRQFSEIYKQLVT